MQLSVNRSFSKDFGLFAIYAGQRLIQAGRTAFALGVAATFFATGTLAANAQASSGAQVAAEFRTAPRSLVTTAVDRARTVLTTGALSRTASKYEDLGRLQPSFRIEHMQLLLRRPAERQAAFDAYVESMHAKGSPNFHRWLTPETVGKEFGPSDADLATIKAYIESEGFTVNYIGKGGYYIDFTGTAAQVERSFNTEMHSFKLPTGESKFAPMRQASIPEALAPLVAGFVSLTDIHTAKPNHEQRIQPAVLRGGSNPQAGEVAQDDPVSGGVTYYAVGPQDFYKIYNENSVLSSGTTGSGVTIALLEESDVVINDVTTFRTTYNIVPATINATTTPYFKVQHVTDVNTCTDPGLVNGDEGEAILDVEWAGAVAPGANLLFMSCKAGTDLGVVYAAQAVVDNNSADVLSLSYGDFEGDTTYGNVDALIANLWEQAASQGQTVVVSAGDAGAAIEDYLIGNPYAYSAGPTANLYASTAWNVSAGGTDFDDTYNGFMGDTAYGNSTYWAATDGAGKESALSYIPESPWNNSCASTIYNAAEEGLNAKPTTFCGSIAYSKNINANVNTVAGGGGPSKERPRPSWQAANSVYGIPAASGANNFRLQPDVSFFAANGLWNHFLESYQSDDPKNCPNGLCFAGGTSYVAPQLAGVFALIKQSTGERLGQPNYVLYDMAATEFGTTTATGACNGSGASGAGLTNSTPSSSCIFYDVQVGNNAVTCGSNSGRATGTFYNCDRTSTASAYGILDNTGTDYTNNNASTSVEAFYTGTGYDMATGIGSINIANLVSNWQNTTTSVLFTPVIALTPATTTYTYGAPPALTYTTQVTGSGSLPTGSVSLSGSPIIGAIGSADPLVPTAACKTGGAVGTTSGTCYEAATQAYTPSATTVSAGTYTITATYSPTNENYISGTGTASIVVNQQTPGFTITAPTGTVAYGTANVVITATLTYTGTGLVPTTANLVSFQVGSFGTFTATCSGTVSPLTCSYTFPLAGVSSGVYPISATYVGDTNYAGATATGTLTYGNASTIGGFTAGNPQHTMYPLVTLTVASNSNGALTYSVTSGPATYQGLVAGKPTFLLTGAGTVVLKASQAAATGAQTYTPTYVSTTFTVLAGSIWIGDTSNAVSTFDLLGNPISGSGTSGLTGGGIVAIASPTGEVFDASGYLWVASSAGVSEFTFPNPTAVSSTPNTSGGISSPVALTIDGTSQIWVANNNGTVSALSNAGVALSPSTGYTYSTVSSSTGGVSVDLSGNLWVTNSADNSVTKIVGVAEPIAPPATALSNGTTGQLP
jgi:hypothetical protein